jgi:sulfate adenylyltransferase subunit 1
MDWMRFATAGSVDDGKSTLIGRLLLETRQILDDQMAAIRESSRRRGIDYDDLALLTDGLRAEREQGITIDVAHRYFQTPLRKFVIADTPGHAQYTRNMVTGASTADLTLLLVDARNGVLEQTRRHAIISSLLGVKHLVLCVNKMDLVGYDAARFNAICEEFTDFSAKLEVDDIVFIPISALNGDNITTRSEQMPWYEGTTLLHHLEHVHIASDRNLIDARFPVQGVIRVRTDEHHNYRGYSGQVASGVFRRGDEVMVVPSGYTTTIAAIDFGSDEIEEAFPPMSVTIRLDGHLDVGRGDLLCRPHNPPSVTQDAEAMICWMSERPLRQGNFYRIKQTTRNARARVQDLKYRLDVNTLHRDTSSSSVGLNDIARVSLRTTVPICVDEYRRNRATGSFILVDETTLETVAGGMILAPAIR